jgi:hypothetical protein
VSSYVAAACIGKAECTIECVLGNHERICAGVNVSDPCGGVAKHLSVSVTCGAKDAESEEQSAHTSPPTTRERQSCRNEDPPIVGLAFRDLYPEKTARSSGVRAQTEAGSGMAAMDLAPRTLINDAQRVALGNMLAALVTNHNSTSSQLATVTGGIIDMAHLAPQLISHG